jgi:hypothetical protein
VGEHLQRPSAPGASAGPNGHPDSVVRSEAPGVTSITKRLTTLLADAARDPFREPLSAQHEEGHPLRADPPGAKVPEALPWASLSGASTAAVATARAVASAPHALRRPSAMLRPLVQVADGLRSFVSQELSAVKEGMSRDAVERRPSPPATFEPTDDTMRKLMSRMRAMMEEERFRRGNIR